MNRKNIAQTIKTMILLEDTRERRCERYYQRRAGFSVPVERQKLVVGDYSCKVSLPSGQVVDLSNQVAIDRKCCLEELIKDLSGTERERFLRECERAKSHGIRLYILVECTGGWNAVIEGRYTSKFGPAQLIGSLMSLEARYGAIVHFIEPKHSAEMIFTFLRYHLKLTLEKIPDTDSDICLTPFVLKLAARYHWTADDLSYYCQCAAQAGVDLESYLDACEEEHQRHRSEEFLRAIAEEEQEEEMEMEREAFHRRNRRLRDAYYELRAAGQSTRDLDLAGVWL